MRISSYSSHEDGHETPHAAAAARNHAPTSQSASKTQSGRYAGAASQSTSSELSLTTAEGDKVVLSISQGSSGAEASQGTDYASLRSRRSEVKIQVEGNLNADELKDITKLAKILAGAANDLLKGDTGHATETVAGANQLSSIQSFAYSLNQQVSYGYSYQEGAQAPVEQPSAGQ